jgi:hypothetical protein
MSGSLALAERMLDLADGDRALGAGLGWTRPYGWAEMWQACLTTWSGRLVAGRLAGERALAASRADGDVENQLWTLCNLAQIAEIEMRDDGAALTHAHQACELAERAGGVYGQVWARACLGVVLTLREEWAPAIDALERAIALARERRSSLDTEAWHLARLAAARLGLGDLEGARTVADEALEIARARRTRFHEVQARIELARVLAACDGDSASAESTRHLDRAAALMHETGAIAYAPQLHRARAECATAAGDDATAAAELAEAERRLAEMTSAPSPRAERATPSAD